MTEESLFHQALEKPTDERAAFVAAACGADAALRQRLEVLLAAHTDPKSFLNRPAVEAQLSSGHMSKHIANGGELAPTSHQVPVASPGTIVAGRFRLLEAIGEGGMGTVWMAEQREPVKRLVALKLIKSGMASKTVLARFEAERQALALMDHPNIAKVLDGGTTEDGRPYFVMELVKGIPLTQYCDERRLSISERLDLFVQICQAVQHAHQKGIIHRDIKPTNILVTEHDGRPVPKVIDFGLAKALQGAHALTEQTLYTAFGAMVGTPLYMAPEQVGINALDVDTRSDVYALGVILYELLTGSTPLEKQRFKEAAWDEICRLIREEEPPRPSVRLSSSDAAPSIAAFRHTEPDKLGRLLRGDLDWIVLKSLEKDRNRRYDTAIGLALDIKRHLANEPIAARPPTSVYRFQKMVRRNKLAFAAGAALVATLVIGTLVSTFFAIQSSRRADDNLTLAKQEAASRADAQLQQQQAEKARANEMMLRERAEEQEKISRRNLYAADMNLVQLAFQANNLGRALRLLDRYRPQPGEEDLRGWEWRYAWQRCQSDAQTTLACNTGPVESICFLPDQGSLVVAGFGGRCVTCELGRPNTIRDLSEVGKAEIADVSHDGTLLATVDASESLRVWKRDSLKSLATMHLAKRFTDLAFSPDARLLATCSLDGAARIWDWENERILHLIPGPSFDAALAGRVVFSSDGKRLAAGGGQGWLRLIDVDTGAELWKTRAHNEPITALAISPDGQTIASAAGFSENGIKLWDSATGRELGKLSGHTAWVGGLAYSPNGLQLTSASADQTVRIWDPVKQEQLAVLRGHRDEVHRAVYSADGRWIASGDKNGVINIWDAPSTTQLEPPQVLPGNSQAARFSRDGSKLVLIHDGVLQVRDAGTLKELVSYPEIGSDNVALAVSPDDSLFAVTDSKARVIVWNAIGHQIIATFNAPIPKILQIDFAPDGKRLIVRGNAKILQYSTADWKPTVSWELKTASFYRIQVFPEVDSLVIENFGNLQILNLKTGVMLRSIPTETKFPVDGVAFAPDGRWCAAGSHDGSVKVFDAHTWREVATLRGHLQGVHNVAFSSDGKRIFTSSSAHEAVKIWDTSTWQELATLEGHGNFFRTLTLSPDGRTLLAVPLSGPMQVWHAPSLSDIETAQRQPTTEASSEKKAENDDDAVAPR